MVWLAVLSIVREITDSLHPSKEPQRGGPIKALGKSMRAQRALTQPRVGDRTRVGRVGWFASKRRLDEAEIGRGLFRSRQTAAGVADRLLDRHRGGIAAHRLSVVLESGDRTPPRASINLRGTARLPPVSINSAAAVRSLAVST